MDLSDHNIHIMVKYSINIHVCTVHDAKIPHSPTLGPENVSAK